MEFFQRLDAAHQSTKPGRRPELKAGPTARPDLVTRAGIIALQRRVGNRATASLVSIGRDAKDGTATTKAPTPPAASPTPAPATAKLAEKTVTVRVTYLKGGSTALSTHVAKANEVYKQASVKVAAGKELTLDEAKSKVILGDDLILDEYSDPKSPTSEEQALLKENRADRAITMYYVKGMSHGSLGEAFWPATGSPVGFVYASTTARTFPHELGHILLDSGDHPADADNFMAQTAVATGKELITADQIKTIRASSFVK